jgi:hypothetical protein
MRRLNNILDLRRYLASLINRLDQGVIDQATASKLAYICSILYRVLLDSDIETRIAALESRIQNREVRQNERKL